jgi:hypothetical protein
MRSRGAVDVFATAPAPAPAAICSSMRACGERAGAAEAAAGAADEEEEEEEAILGCFFVFLPGNANKRELPRGPYCSLEESRDFSARPRGSGRAGCGCVAQNGQSLAGEVFSLALLIRFPFSRRNPNLLRPGSLGSAVRRDVGPPIRRL